jgi:mono/diheme cytochrome c family protein
MTLHRNSVLVGAAAVVLLGVLGTAAAIGLGLFNVSADRAEAAPVCALKVWARERSIAVRAHGTTVPALTPEMSRAGADEYVEMCVSCHLAPGLSENEMRPGLNPRPPVIAALPAGNPARQFWIVKHGIKMTGMPAWGKTHSDEEIWTIVAFLQELPKLSAAEYQAIAAGAAGHHDHDADH